MVGRNRIFKGHSEWMNEFNKVHNPDYYYDKKTKRRKPKRKKQIVDATQPNDIPYSKYRIEWMDILSDSGWLPIKNLIG